MSDIIITAMEIIGTVAFAISGALISVSCGLDIFGVVFIGVITATGGGILRDVLTGRTPPLIFSNIHIFAVAAITALIVFIISFIHKNHFNTMRDKIDRINNIFDAVGLAAFTVTGTEIVLASGCSDKMLLCVIMGMLTGCGGGMLRDVLVDKTPYVLKKHVYALASLFGSILYYLIRMNCENEIIGTVVATVSVILIRLLATKYHWKLPKINISDKTV